MTEASLIPDTIPTAAEASAIAPVTALAAAMLRQGLVGAETLVEYRGARTFARLGEPGSELRGLVNAAGVSDRGARVRLRVTGDDRVRWLNGMVTNNIKALAAGAHNYSFVLNAQGRIQGDVTVFAFGDSLVIETDRSQAERLHGHLDRFIIMDDVELGWIEGESTLGLAGPRAADVLAAIELPAPAAGAMAATQAGTVVGEYSVAVPRYSLWVEEGGVLELWRQLTEAGAVFAGVDAVEMLRLGEGLPLYGADITDKSLPQETGQTQALNFNKGCYLGQEIVERIRSQAKVHRGLRVYRLSGEASAGMPLTTDGKVAGELTTVGTGVTGGSGSRLAMASVRLELAAERKELAYEGGTAQAVSLPCFELDQPLPANEL